MAWSLAAARPAPRLPWKALAAWSEYSPATRRPAASAAVRASASCVGIEPRSSSVLLAA